MTGYGASRWGDGAHDVVARLLERGEPAPAVASTDRPRRTEPLDAVYHRPAARKRPPQGERSFESPTVCVAGAG